VAALPVLVQVASRARGSGGRHSASLSGYDDDNNNNSNYVALVCERTIRTERPQLVGEVSTNFLRIEGVA
jgi:hypothetical protein